jgi:hypothetical protein
MKDRTVNRFRQKRGRRLAQRLKRLSEELGRPLSILDVGGRRDYWDNVGFDGIGRITLVNYDPAELDRGDRASDLFEDVVGDARALSNIGDAAYDFYHSNSVIEHVGGWSDMEAMAKEAVRVAPHGWLQTPAWEFPIEPHFRLPFMHWLARPARAGLLKFSKPYRTLSRPERRFHVERINLLSRYECQLLFPDARIDTERLLFLSKSYMAVW